MQPHASPPTDPRKPAMPLRPLAARENNGRITVYVGASYQQLQPAAAWALLGQLATALDVPGWPPIYRFLAWVSGLHQLPDREAVMQKFHVSYATAYRWISLERARREEAACSSDK